MIRERLPRSERRFLEDFKILSRQEKKKCIELSSSTVIIPKIPLKDSTFTVPKETQLCAFGTAGSKEYCYLQQLLEAMI